MHVAVQNAHQHPSNSATTLRIRAVSGEHEINNCAGNRALFYWLAPIPTQLYIALPKHAACHML
jgi:hypothetical protein